MEEMKKADRRIAKTKKAIRNAFVKLLVEKDIDKISVKEIADLADVDRKTVYNYYAGVYEIREELENDLLADLKKCTHDLVYDINDPMSVFRVFARIIEENYEVYSQLITSYGPYTSAKLYYYLKELVRDTILTSPRVKKERIDLAVEFITGGMLWVYNQWFTSNKTVSLEEFTLTVGKMVVDGVSAYLIED